MDGYYTCPECGHEFTGIEADADAYVNEENEWAFAYMCPECGADVDGG